MEILEKLFMSTFVLLAALTVLKIILKIIWR